MEYQVKTPDGTSIKFQKILKQEKEALINSDSTYLLKELNRGVYVIPVYKISNGRYLYCLTRDDYALLFENEGELNKMTRGQKYYQLDVIFDKKQKAHCSFSLNSEDGYQIIKNNNYEILGEYTNQPGTEIYTCYLLENGNVCFLYDRTEYMKGGDWYENLETFKFYMKVIWNR